jgi:MFS-type transporter involved in bile tolerance (Atg22 family)
MGKEEEMDSISNKAFAYGYFGGGILLLFHLILVMGVDGAWVIPFAMASSGVWWFGFALITFARVPEPPIENEMEKLGLIDSAKLSITELKKTVSEAKNFKTLFIYMLAYFFFIDGINSVTSLAGIYGITVLGISITGLILTILIIQFVAAPAAIGFTILASKWGTKRVLTASLFGWCIVIVGALSFAPLELIDHAEYDIMYDWDETNSTYVVAVSSGISDISQDDGEQAWIQTHADVLPVIQNNKVTEKTSMQWSVDDAGPVNVSLAVGSESSITSFMNSVNSSRYSVSVNGGGLANATAVGLDHPTNLGEGAIDFIPVLIRKVIWAPLGISVFFQWLLLGVMAGLLLGGSQGLARSLFGQMVPETRSAEFFGFFGFFGKVAALFGPLLYATLTVMFDSRVGILSIGALIIIGAVLMRWVDVEDGIAVARAEDAANRS